MTSTIPEQLYLFFFHSPFPFPSNTTTTIIHHGHDHDHDQLSSASDKPNHPHTPPRVVVSRRASRPRYHRCRRLIVDSSSNSTATATAATTAPLLPAVA